MEQLILALLIWLGAHTEYNTAVSLPQIEYKTMREMSDMMYGDTPLENRWRFWQFTA